MEPLKVEVTITPDGMKVKVLNAQGSSCKSLTAALEQGATQVSSSLLPEYFEEPIPIVTQNQSVEVY